MTWRVRRSKKLGPICLTFSRRGLSTSVRFGDVRQTVRTPRSGDGRQRSTLSHFDGAS
jgi:hypothetical protein